METVIVLVFVAIVVGAIVIYLARKKLGGIKIVRLIIVCIASLLMLWTLIAYDTVPIYPRLMVPMGARITVITICTILFLKVLKEE